MPDIVQEPPTQSEIDAERVKTLLESTPSGLPLMSIVRQLSMPEQRAHEALMELRRAQLVRMHAGSWRMRPPPKMLVPELGLPDTQRNRRWLAMFNACSPYCSSQDQARELAWLMVRTWEETK